MQATSSDKRPLEGRHQEAEESHLDDIHNIRAYGAEVDKYSDGSINTVLKTYGDHVADRLWNGVYRAEDLQQQKKDEGSYHSL
ncbi:hypothetical protein P8452_58170 [Trifolium repens]|nr:hypothetical protein P8452_58170 [Trifolium repens]